MKKEKEAVKIIDKLAVMYPQADIHLKYNSPVQLLIATILAAQCTDAKVNEVTPKLWEAFPSIEDIASAEAEQLHKILRPTGFFRQKTKSVQNVCRALIDKFDGDVPRDMKSLTALPGVGRKTANVVLANVYSEDAIPVDTHVKRVSLRLGLASDRNPDKIEKELCEAIPKGKHSQAALVIGEHGRNVCKSRKPDCENCGVSHLCDFYADNQNAQAVRFNSPAVLVESLIAIAVLAVAMSLLVRFSIAGIEQVGQTYLRLNAALLAEGKMQEIIRNRDNLEDWQAYAAESYPKDEHHNLRKLHVENYDAFRWLWQFNDYGLQPGLKSVKVSVYWRRPGRTQFAENYVLETLLAVPDKIIKEGTINDEE